MLLFGKLEELKESISRRGIDKLKEMYKALIEIQKGELVDSEKQGKIAVVRMDQVSEGGSHAKHFKGIK